MGDHQQHSIEELKILVRDSYEEGILGAHEERMLTRTFDFGDRTVREVMIPRTDIVAIEYGATLDDVLQLFKRYRHSRFPIYEEDLDRIVYIVTIKDVLLALAEGPQVREKTLEESEVLRPAFFTPGSHRVGDLLLEMREANVQMAIVLDEHGGTAGLVTIEELIEEIVGNISDEEPNGFPPIQQVGDREWEIDALVRIDELKDELGIAIPERNGYDTIAGFLMWFTGKVPSQGEEIRWRDWRFTVLEMQGPKIERVRMAGDH